MITRITHSNGVVTWQSPLLAAAGVPHAFSTRIGGVSARPFDSLNLGNPAGCGAPDTDGNLRENYQRLQAAMAMRPMLRAWARQVHGARVIQIAAEPEAEYGEALEAQISDRFHGQIEADALLTDIPNLLVTVRIADCVPILMADRGGHYVAAVHAGWRGVVAGIVPRTIRAFAECDIGAGDLIAAIGPHISVEHFEVGPEVAAAFAAAGLGGAVRGDLGDRPHVDLQAALRMQLGAVGQVEGTDQCTFANAGDFYSHRRDQGVTGRMAAVIGRRG